MAAAAEKLRSEWPEQLVLSIGSEVTLFTKGRVSSNTFMERLRNPSLRETVKAGKHNKLLNAFLAKANEAVRQVFHGQVASLLWETVDWRLFDFIGVDHFCDARIKDRYVEMLKPLFTCGKPVTITEFGSSALVGFQSSSATGSGIVDVFDHKTLFLHRVPLLGRLVRQRLNGEYVRDEAYQGRELAETLGIRTQQALMVLLYSYLSFLFIHITRILDLSRHGQASLGQAMATAGRGVPTQTCRGNQSSRLERWPSTTPHAKLGSVHP